MATLFKLRGNPKALNYQATLGNFVVAKGVITLGMVIMLGDRTYDGRSAAKS